MVIMAMRSLVGFGWIDMYGLTVVSSLVFIYCNLGLSSKHDVSTFGKMTNGCDELGS